MEEDANIFADDPTLQAFVREQSNFAVNHPKIHKNLALPMPKSKLGKQQKRQDAEALLKSMKGSDAEIMDLIDKWHNRQTRSSVSARMTGFTVDLEHGYCYARFAYRLT